MSEELKVCVNCGEKPDHHHIAGRALICNRQFYYAPTHDHPNARPRPSISEEKIEEMAYSIHESFHVGCPSDVRPGCIDFIKRKVARLIGEVRDK